MVLALCECVSVKIEKVSRKCEFLTRDRYARSQKGMYRLSVCSISFKKVFLFSCKEDVENNDLKEILLRSLIHIKLSSNPSLQDKKEAKREYPFLIFHFLHFSVDSGLFR